MWAIKMDSRTKKQFFAASRRISKGKSKKLAPKNGLQSNHPIICSILSDFLSLAGQNRRVLEPTFLQKRFEGPVLQGFTMQP
jgi:hypothetical protein